MTHVLLALAWAATMQVAANERAAFYDAALAPSPGAIEIPAALQSKKPKDVAEAAASYDRGLVFVSQGAWKEAEKELRNAEKKTDNDVQAYVFAAAYSYLKLHRSDDALKRYERYYKKDPTNLRALAGMAAAYEDMQRYRDAVAIWQRYARMPLPREDKAAADRMLAGARELFATYYEIAENPAGGAQNLATPQQELAWGLQYAQQLSATGVPLLRDEVVVGYVQGLCQELVSHAKQFPTNYEVYVLDSATVNAMTTPGYIFVFRGILTAAKTEDELAGVLAHEIGHSVAHHVAKAQTKQALDQRQLEQLKQSNNKFSQFLAKMAAVGNPLGELSFSRENEAQSDRLAVHIAYDAGFNPDGLVGMFRTFESMSPSSRSSWDLMARTHPFSIDRANTVTDYAALLPPRAPRQPSRAFAQMKARLAKLPPPADATGLMKAAAAPSPTAPPAVPAGATRSFSIDDTPLTGEIPADWGARKSQSGTIVFEGERGTDAYEVSIELEVLPKSMLEGRSMKDVAQTVYDQLSRRPAAQIKRPQATQTDRGQPASMIAGFYSMPAQGREVPFKHLSALIEYDQHLIIFSYYGPTALFDRFAPVYEQIGGSLRYRGR